MHGLTGETGNGAPDHGPGEEQPCRKPRTTNGSETYHRTTIPRQSPTLHAGRLSCVYRPATKLLIEDTHQPMNPAPHALTRPNVSDEHRNHSR